MRGSPRAFVRPSTLAELALVVPPWIRVLSDADLLGMAEPCFGSYRSERVDRQVDSLSGGEALHVDACDAGSELLNKGLLCLAVSLDRPPPLRALIGSEG